MDSSSESGIEYSKEPRHGTREDMMRLVRENEAKGIQTTLYDWKFPKVLDAPVPVSELAPNVARLRMLTMKLNRKNPGWDNDRVRAHLKVKYPEFRDMANRTHPHLFLMVTDRELSDQNFKRIADLLSIRIEHEKNNNLTENTETISAYFHQEFMPKK
jgi:hypothetical protein